VKSAIVYGREKDGADYGCRLWSETCC